MDFDSLTSQEDEGNSEVIDQYLTFVIDEELYGIDILKIREIKGWEGVREVPNTPDFMKGVINLRGTMVPVVDMRLRFGMKEVEYVPTTVVIVVSVELEGKEIIVAFVVDAVSDVMDISQNDFRDVPTFGCKIEARYMSGMAVIDEKTIILLNADEILEEHELDELDKVSE
ncbi:MAG: purine-binding chemotaxis protein CheW [Gammaproteobacteria bacterium]|nr:MAG: purine-binding chemotaxis protein CheW [Gammaproteobacteria bacterium]